MTSNSSDTERKLPQEIVDSHHHFLDTKGNEFQSFVGKLVPNELYMPEDYYKDVVQPLEAIGLSLKSSVHVECLPDDGVREASWVQSLLAGNLCTVKSIVGSCDLASPTVEESLAQLLAASPKVHGIRWILDCVGPYKPDTATHVGTSRHDGVDYLRGSNGGYDGSVVPAFERGFALLEKHGLSFDLQCAPAQLLAAADLFRKYPNIPICIDHLGKPRKVYLSSESIDVLVDEQELAVWREGMRAMAELPHVYIKLSMLGWAVPNWSESPKFTTFTIGLVKEVIELFSPQRCMVAFNWWKNAALSDSDGLGSVGPSPQEFVLHLSAAMQAYSDEDRERVFSGTAKEFYKL